MMNIDVILFLITLCFCVVLFPKSMGMISFRKINKYVLYVLWITFSIACVYFGAHAAYTIMKDNSQGTMYFDIVILTCIAIGIVCTSPEILFFAGIKLPRKNIITLHIIRIILLICFIFECFLIFSD